MGFEEDLREANENEEEERKAVRQDGWMALGRSFTASALMTVSTRLPFRQLDEVLIIYFLYSCFRTSSPSSSPFLYLVRHSQKIGYGLSHPVYPTSDKVSLWASQQH